MSSVLSQIKSVNKFLGDLHEAVKDTPWPAAIAQALPWSAYIGEALADAVGPIKFITTLWSKYSAVTDVNEQGILIGRLAFQRSVQQAFQAVIVEIAQSQSRQFNMSTETMTMKRMYTSTRSSLSVTVHAVV